MQIGVIGARALPETQQNLVEEVVQYLLGRGHIIAHGGALGDVAQYLNLGGKVSWGGGESGMPYPAVAAALLARNARLVTQCHGLVAFLHGKSKGTLSAVAQAQKLKIPIILFPLSDHIDLPQQKGMRWYPIAMSGLFAGALKAMYSSFHPPTPTGYGVASVAPAPRPAGAYKQEALIYA